MAGINQTSSRVQVTADDHLEDKLLFEKKMLRDLSTYFNQLAEDYRVVYDATGQVMTMNESYNDELNALLKKNYRLIAKKFSGLTQEQLNDSIDEIKYEIDKEKQNSLKQKIAMAIGSFLLLRSKKIAPKISDTTQNVMLELTNNYIVTQAKLGNIATNTEIADAVSKQIKSWGKAHSTVVATTEVQNVAETSKNIENVQIKNSIKEEVQRINQGGEVIAGKLPHQLTAEEMADAREIAEIAQKVDLDLSARKTWITAGDEKVRSSHRMLDSISVGQEDFFITGEGSIMKFAGDMESGAKLSDVINCRCTTVYKYDGDAVSMYRNSIFKRKII